MSILRWTFQARAHLSSLGISKLHQLRKRQSLVIKKIYDTINDSEIDLHSALNGQRNGVIDINNIKLTADAGLMHIEEEEFQSLKLSTIHHSEKLQTHAWCDGQLPCRSCEILI